MSIDGSGVPVPLATVTSVTHTEHRNLLVTGQETVRITLNRPEKRNALSLELMEEMIAALREASGQPATRSIVIEGAGKAFSAGHDLQEMIGRDEAFYRELFGVCTVMMETIHELSQPVIAKVNGVATAAGCQLVAACDLAVAADGARFATPGVNIGLFCTTPMVPVSRAIGRKRAMQLLLTGEPIDAAKALFWGLVDRVAPADELDAAVDELARPILAAGPRAIRVQKALILDWEELPLSAAITRGIDAFVSAFDSGEPGCMAGAAFARLKARPRE